MQVALDLRGSVFAERLFLALDDQKTGHVSCEQLVAALLALQHGSLEEKIAFAFSIVNSNTSGSLSLQQLEEVLQVRPKKVQSMMVNFQSHCDHSLKSATL